VLASPAEPTVVRQLWLPQFEFQQRNEVSPLLRNNFTELEEFPSLGKRLLLREEVSMSYTEMTNSGLEITLQGEDKIIRPPAVVMLISDDIGKTPMFCRLILEGLT
jgi:hypothetical protein